MMPKISIIMPVYNKEEKVVNDCIHSILNQIEKDFELIIVDDASNASLVSFLENISKIDERIKLIKHSKNQGVSAARNSALEIASGKFIGFVDADDMVAPNHYELLLNAIETLNVDIVIGKSKSIPYEFSFEDCTNADAVDLTKVNGNKKVILASNDRGLWNKIYRHDVIKNCRFNTKFHAFEDLIFINHAVLLADKIVSLDLRGYYYRAANPAILENHRQRDENQRWQANLSYHSLHLESLEELIKLLNYAKSKKDKAVLIYVALRRMLRFFRQIRKINSYEQKNQLYKLYHNFVGENIKIIKEIYPIFGWILEKGFTCEDYKKSKFIFVNIYRIIFETVFVKYHSIS